MLIVIGSVKWLSKSWIAVLIAAVKPVGAPLTLASKIALMCTEVSPSDPNRRWHVDDASPAGPRQLIPFRATERAGAAGRGWAQRRERRIDEPWPGDRCYRVDHLAANPCGQAMFRRTLYQCACPLTKPQ